MTEKISLTIIDDTTGDIIARLSASSIQELDQLEGQFYTDYALWVEERTHKNGSRTRFVISTRESDRRMSE